MAQEALHHTHTQTQEDHGGISRVFLQHFRSWEHLSFGCETTPVILTGPNGAGKTNILEALSLLAPGQGLRSAKLSHITSHAHASHTPWSVSVHVREGSLSPMVLGTSLEMRDGKERRVIQLDGRHGVPQSELPQVLGVVWLTPAMDRLFMDAAASRRRFLDRLVAMFAPHHASLVAKYEYCVRERLRLLKDGRSSPQWLDALEEKAAQAAVAIAAARLSLVERLNGAKELALGFLPRPSLSLEGDVEDLVRAHPALRAEEDFQKMLAASRTLDAGSGRTQCGAHKSDLIVTYEGRVPAASCSTGEQKALLLSLMMAAVRLRARTREGVPLLLLDEVIAHLDEGRRVALLEEISHLNIQTWMTGTHPCAFASMKGRMQHFQLENGTLTPL